MQDHPLFTEDMQEIVDSFVVESREILDDLDNDLLQLEKTPDDAELVDTVFRAVHTIKGTSGFLSLEQLSVLAHQFEDVLNRLRKKSLAFDPKMMDVLFAAFDRMCAWIEKVDNRDLEPIDQSDIVANLKTIAEGSLDGLHPQEESPAPAADTSPRAAEMRVSETIRVRVDRLDNLVDLVGELVLGRNRLLQFTEELHLANTSTSASTLRQLKDMSAQVDFITTELQNAVMHTRMVPIGRMFNKFPRIVRDLGREFGKKIDLRLEGEETELDKSLVEEISDPLVHLIRNAADHGIETPKERKAAGKPEEGRITLSAAHEGNHIIISITDDGAGLSPKAIKEKALEKNLVTASEAQEMSENEILNLIFRPGFSTAAQVSQVSGRGVGMDVVKTNIHRLNGHVSIHSRPGKGARFILKLPLTLAIIQSLLARVGDEIFAVPLHSVTEVVGLDRSELDTVHGREVLRHRDQVLPLLRVSEILDVEDARACDAYAYVIIVYVGGKWLGLLVDSLLSQNEIVIKPLGSYLKNVAGIAGSTILGDGRVIMILDLPELVRMHNHALTKTLAAAA